METERNTGRGGAEEKEGSNSAVGRRIACGQSHTWSLVIEGRNEEKRWEGPGLERETGARPCYKLSKRQTRSSAGVGSGEKVEQAGKSVMSSSQKVI